MAVPTFRRMLSPRWTALPAPDGSQTHCSVVAVQLTLRNTEAGAVLDTWVDRVVLDLPTSALLGAMVTRTRTDLHMVSAWSRRSDMAAFERAGVHGAAKQDLRAHVLPPTVAVWTELVAALPPSWDEVRRRLAAARTRQRPDSASASTGLTASPPDQASGRTTS